MTFWTAVTRSAASHALLRERPAAPPLPPQPHGLGLLLSSVSASSSAGSCLSPPFPSEKGDILATAGRGRRGTPREPSRPFLRSTRAAALTAAISRPLRPQPASPGRPSAPLPAAGGAGAVPPRAGAGGTVAPGLAHSRQPWGNLGDTRGYAGAEEGRNKELIAPCLLRFP